MIAKAGCAQNLRQLQGTAKGACPLWKGAGPFGFKAARPLVIELLADDFSEGFVTQKDTLWHFTLTGVSGS